MTGFESIIKAAPVVAAVVAVCVGFGELKADMANVKEQMAHMQAQLDQIQTVLSGHK